MLVFHKSACLVIATIESMQDYEPPVTDENKSSIQVTKMAQKDKETPVLLQQTYIRETMMRKTKPGQLFGPMRETVEHGGDSGTKPKEEYATGNDADQERNMRKGPDGMLRSIPAKAGGPYLCDSDSDVTVPITVVENLEMVEDSED